MNRLKWYCGEIIFDKAISVRTYNNLLNANNKLMVYWNVARSWSVVIILIKSIGCVWVYRYNVTSNTQYRPNGFLNGFPTRFPLVIQNPSNCCTELVVRTSFSKISACDRNDTDVAVELIRPITEVIDVYTFIRIYIYYAFVCK